MHQHDRSRRAKLALPIRGLQLRFADRMKSLIANCWAWVQGSRWKHQSCGGWCVCTQVFQQQLPLQILIGSSFVTMQSRLGRQAHSPLLAFSINRQLFLNPPKFILSLCFGRRVHRRNHRITWWARGIRVRREKSFFFFSIFGCVKVYHFFKTFLNLQMLWSQCGSSVLSKNFNKTSVLLLRLGEFTRMPLYDAVVRSHSANKLKVVLAWSFQENRKI